VCHRRERRAQSHPVCCGSLVRGNYHSCLCQVATSRHLCQQYDRETTCCQTNASHIISNKNTHTQTQAILRLSRSWYQEKTFTHSHLLWPSVIPYLLPPSITIHGILPVQFLHAWQTFSTISLQVFFGLPLGLAPSTSYTIHFFIQRLGEEGVFQTKRTWREVVQKKLSRT